MVRRRALGGVIAIVAGATLVQCSWSLDDLSSGGPATDAGEASTLGADAGPGLADGEAALDGAVPDAGLVETGAPSCGGRPGVGATMVRVLDAGFCIDTTEVTLDQYQAFIASNPPIPPECAWKTAYTPAAFSGSAAIGNVDWCDANGYCKWAGKRLCRGRGGVTLDLTSSRTPTSEWQYACTHGGDPMFSYPYGDTADPSICLYSNSPDSGQARPVASNPKCTGPAGIFDLSGNVWEWEDACDRSVPNTTAAADCNLRGGGFLRDSSSWGSCAAVPGGWARDSHVEDTGIRCCSDYQ